jgi:hypothetical protein
MESLLARVINGRIVLDEPTSLPDGAEVEVVVLDDDLSAEDRSELHASIERALEEVDAGQTLDARAFLAAHRARLARR